MSKFWNGLATALASGAITAFASCMTQTGPIAWKHCGIMAVTGATVGVVNLFRETPTAAK